MTAARVTDTSRAIVTKEDIDQAQSVIDAWLPDPVEDYRHGGTFDSKAFMLLRGLITQALADAHATGFEQGCDRGRRMIGNRLRDLLQDEGC